MNIGEGMNDDEIQEELERLSKMDPKEMFGKPGEPVPEVDPQDVKHAWEWTRDNPGKQSGFGVLLAVLDKIPDNPMAVGVRAAMLSLMQHFAAEQLATFTKDGQLDEVVFYAAAKVPMVWLLDESRQGPPFDMEEFIRLAKSQKRQ